MKKRIKKLKLKIISLFSQGLSSKKIAQSIIFSGLFTVIPILGISTFFITFISIKKKLNLPIMIAFSYVIWPVQIFLIIPFIRLGEIIFSIPPTHHSIEEIIEMSQNGFFKMVTKLSLELLYALGAWFLVAVPVALGIYGVTMIILKIVSKKESIL
jgi:hypothetical protein